MKTIEEILIGQMEVAIFELKFGEYASEDYIEEQQDVWRNILQTANTSKHVHQAMREYAQQFIDAADDVIEDSSNNSSDRTIDESVLNKQLNMWHEVKNFNKY